MDVDSRSVQNAIVALEAMGIKVKPVPRIEGKKTADLHAWDSQDEYAIEVKSSHELAEFEAQAQQETLVTQSMDLGRSNAMSKVIRDAAEQLKSTVSRDDQFQIMWFRPEQLYHGKEVMHQLVSTLYGLAYLPELGNDSGDRTNPCFFLHFNKFYEEKDLDGVVVHIGGTGKIFLNPLSNRHGAFRRSEVCKYFDKQDVVFDPNKFVSQGNAYDASDIEGSRKDLSKIISKLGEKYGKRFGPPFSMMAFTGIASVPQSARLRSKENIFNESGKDE